MVKRKLHCDLKGIMSARIHGLAVLTAAMALAACDDSAKSNKPTADAGCTGFGGCGETGGEGGGGGTGGTGGTGGEEPPGKPCVDDGVCAEDEYCDKAPDALEGDCSSGCREGGCGTGEECNLDARE